MTEQASSPSQLLHVITLISSTAPIPLPQFQSPRLEGLAVFRSRRVDDGRERFRIHLGFFASAAEAEEMLPVVREIYPWAFVGPAPQSNLGSLDDTASTRFTVVRTAEFLAPTPASPVRDAAPVIAAPEAQPAAVTKAAPQPKAAQRYAVQLMWSKQPIDVAKIANIGIFAGYLLYAVETAPGSRRMYGVRLGFYDDELSARLVALYVRPTFKAMVVPVSAREVASASGATIRLSGSRPARGRITPREQWPHSAVAVAFVHDTNDLASPPI